MRTSCKALGLLHGPILALVTANRHLAVLVECVSCCQPVPLQPGAANTVCVSKFARWTTRRSFLFARREKFGPRSRREHEWRPQRLSRVPEVASDQAQES